MSSRTPRPEDEYPPLDTDDGDRYIPTSRELADQYLRDRAARDGGAEAGRERATADDGAAPAPSVGNPRHDDGDGPGGPGGPDETEAPVADPAASPGTRDSAAGEARDGVRVTRPVALQPDGSNPAGIDEPGHDEPAHEGSGHGGFAGRPGSDETVEAADRAVPATDDDGQTWRERYDHTAAMDAWDREFGADAGATTTAPVTTAAGKAPDGRGDDEYGADGRGDDERGAPLAGTGPDKPERAVGTDITETDARSDAGRAAPGATTIDRRTEATQPAHDDEHVPAPLGAADSDDREDRDEDGGGLPADPTAGAGAGAVAAHERAGDEDLPGGRVDGLPDDRANKHHWVSADNATDARDDHAVASPAGVDRGAGTGRDDDGHDDDGHDADGRDADGRDAGGHAGERKTGPAGATVAAVSGAAATGDAVAVGSTADGAGTGTPADREAVGAAGAAVVPDTHDRNTHDRNTHGRGTGTRDGEAVTADETEEEARRRATRRDAALEGKPAAGRFWQVVLAIAFPVVLLVAAIRAAASPLFLWIEYHRPGFPADSYGFTTDDRLTWGSAVADYINNFANPRYLTQLPGKEGGSLLTEGEVSHMVDVKNVIGVAYVVAAVLVVLGLIALVYLAKRYLGGVRRGLFAGSVVTLVVIIALGVFAAIDWSLFFTTFHRVLFAQGNWTFYENDALIRLFPAQFWIDSGIVIGAIVLVVSLVTLIMTWPTRRRRARSRAAQEALRRSVAEQEESVAV